MRALKDQGYKCLIIAFPLEECLPCPYLVVIAELEYLSMTAPKTPFFANLVPFFIAGVSIGVMIALPVLFSYVLFWGFLIGLILWVVMTIKNKLFSSKQSATINEVNESKHGRTIEHDEI